jgi:two-component system, NtrC family, C4-dicarboxylate transport sensor histidine kinase DctB
MDILSKTDMNEFNKSILDSTEFLSKTIDTFRNFIKEEKIYKEVILQDRIKKAFEIIDVTLKDEFIRLIDDIDYSEPIKINLIVGELAQVILNLINNSKDALIEKNINEPWVKVSIEKLEEKVVIIIEDNAGGIKEDVLPHIFEPYFTTKHQSQGTGLGLYMSKEIVEKHLEGKLYVKNTSEGAKFYVELPLSISI